jgi:hypothetical protein
MISGDRFGLAKQLNPPLTTGGVGGALYEVLSHSYLIGVADTAGVGSVVKSTHRRHTAHG